MGAVDFPTWFSIGSYGGLAVSLLTTASVAVFALRLHRGTPRQLARATLACLFCCCLMFAPILWYQNRFGLLGPTLAPTEVAIWLVWTALAGWALPLSIASGYVALARPQPLTGMLSVPPGARATVAGTSIVLTRPDDPGRLLEPLGAGRAWGQLVPVGGPFAERPLPLTRQIILMGREPNCDVIVRDEQASRHHAELRWDHGRVHLVDRGSLNGTRVNGMGVPGQVPLRPGDMIEIGAAAYRFEMLPAGTQEDAATTPQLGSLDAEETRKVAGAARGTRQSTPRTVPALVLVALNGPRPNACWPLGSLSGIGRESSNAIQLADPSVSRQHAQIVRQVNGYYVQDVDSQNGTLLNGQPLAEPTLLRPGDVIQVGEVTLACEVAPPSLSSAGGAPSASAASELAQRAVAASSDTHRLLEPLQRPAEGATLAPPRLVPTPQERADREY